MTATRLAGASASIIAVADTAPATAFSICALTAPAFAVPEAAADHAGTAHKTADPSTARGGTTDAGRLHRGTFRPAVDAFIRFRRPPTATPR